MAAFITSAGYHAVELTLQYEAHQLISGAAALMRHGEPEVAHDMIAAGWYEVRSLGPSFAALADHLIGASRNLVIENDHTEGRVIGAAMDGASALMRRMSEGGVVGEHPGAAQRILDLDLPDGARQLVEASVEIANEQRVTAFARGSIKAGVEYVRSLGSPLDERMADGIATVAKQGSPAQLIAEAMEGASWIMRRNFGAT